MIKVVRPTTNINGLYLVGQDIITAGVGTACASSIIAAYHILN